MFSLCPYDEKAIKMLSKLEYVGLKEILDDIDDDDLFSILETVTKRMFSTKNRNGIYRKCFKY